jgi:hypothetical protein
MASARRGCRNSVRVPGDRDLDVGPLKRLSLSFPGGSLSDGILGRGPKQRPHDADHETDDEADGNAGDRPGEDSHGAATLIAAAAATRIE